MDRLVVGDLTIVVDDSEPGVIRLRWEGMSNSKDPGQALRPFFAIVAARAAESALAIEHRFEALRYMNSSTITALLQLIHEGKERGFRQRVFYDGTLRWQSLNFEALRALTGGGTRFELIALRKDEKAVEESGH